MAVDEVLLQTALSNRLCSLRLYRWELPTLSLGYFQQSAPLEGPVELAALPRVRRLSGGGAILHDQEITYSCGLPPGHPLSGSPEEAYLALHRAIVSTLADFSLSCALRGEVGVSPEAGFLCFGRKDRFDVVSRGCKVLGSAQRRRKGAVLQHGSLLLFRSKLTPQFPGLLDLCGRSDEPAGLAERLAESLASRVADAWARGSLTGDELERARNVSSREVATNVSANDLSI